MLTIRLQRGGKRNTPMYKVVLAQKTAANQKQFVEVIGSYNPHNKELTIRDQERLNYWMNDQHVELSETVHNLFVTKDILKADKKKAFTVPKKPVEAVAEEAPAAEAPAAEAAEGGDAGESTDAAESVTETASETPAETTPEAAPEVPTEVPAPETATPETPEVTAETPAEEVKA
ncbi:30S ribosomal protein S16 [bacterium]|nr:MAG: 30S ribosomal protein S16 [bacterium]